jgi:hypothetical protein
MFCFMQVSTPAPVVKRRRLTGKQRSENDLTPPPVRLQAIPTQEHNEVDDKIDVQQRNAEYERLRSCWVKTWFQVNEKDPDVRFHDHRLRGRQCFARLTARQRLTWIEKYREDLQSQDISDFTIKWFLNQEQNVHGKVSTEHAFLHAHSGLITFNGDWGVVTPEDVGLQGSCADKDVDEVVRLIQPSAKFKKLIEAAEAWKHDKTLYYRFKACSIGLELCTTTLKNEGVMRVHCHAYVECSHRMHVRCGTSLAFLNSIGVLSGMALGQRKRQNSRSNGMYYIMSPKIGALWHVGTHQPFVDYHVNAEMVTNMVQARVVYIFVASSVCVLCDMQVVLLGVVPP